MKAIPITTKNVSVFVAIILMTFGLTSLFYDFSSTIKDKPAEEKVEVKYSKKGLYSYPRYKIHVTNSEQPSTVTREQFELIEPGDTVAGYMKNEDSFVTDQDIQFDKTLGIPILIFLYLGVLVFGGGLFRSTKFFKNNAAHKRTLYKMYKGVVFTSVALYIITGLVFIGIMATNLFHKINTGNQTEVTATVLDSEDEVNRIVYRGIKYNTYELLLAYQDEEGEEHLTKKAMSSTTYKKYNTEETLPLTYRNNNVYDTFISTRDGSEMIGAFLTIETTMLGFYIVTLIVIIRVWRKRKRNYQEEG